MKHDFEERRQKRIATAKIRAIKNEQEAETLYNSAKELASIMPMGQPILIGHHSERRDRNYRDIIHNKFGKSFEKSEKAVYYKNKAESIEQNDVIFSDDPNALEKLNEKLKSLENSQEFMKLTNKFIRKNDKEGFLKIRFATDKIWEEMTTPNVMGAIGFAHYSLNNNNANIRQVKKRITQLKHREVNQPVDKVINGVRIFEKREANRLQIIFRGKPGEDTRKQLKANGFRWSPTEGAWQRHISNWAFRCARGIAENLK
jgi:Domain of unknown function (DUF3560)